MLLAVPAYVTDVGRLRPRHAASPLWQLWLLVLAVAHLAVLMLTVGARAAAHAMSFHVILDSAASTLKEAVARLDKVG